MRLLQILASIITVGQLRPAIVSEIKDVMEMRVKEKRLDSKGQPKRHPRQYHLALAPNTVRAIISHKEGKK